MDSKYLKVILATVWLLAMSVAAVSVDLRSVGGWAILLCVALPPPLIMMRIWNPPRETMSESIHKILR
jgi:hypothetical protein